MFTDHILISDLGCLGAFCLLCFVLFSAHAERGYDKIENKKNKREIEKAGSNVIT